MSDRGRELASAADQAVVDARNADIHGRSGRVFRALQRANEGLSDEHRRTKYGKMAASPYAFYRGSNHLFWMDFEWDWRLTRFGSYRTRTWLNGDCHAYNFGAYHSHGVGVVYGLNDFDEAIVADYQYDLWRLAVSLVLIAREGKKLGRSDQATVIDALAQSYLDSLRGFDGNRKAEETCYTARNTYGQLRNFLRKVAKKDSRGKLIGKWTIEGEEGNRFDLASEKLAPAPEETAQKLRAAFPAYVETVRSDRTFGDGFFDIKDIALRLGAGTGSLGTERYYVLIEGEGGAQGDDVILDVKRQSPPSAYPYASEKQIGEYHRHFPNEGIRHAIACRALGFHPDDLLGWLKLDDDFYSVRERSPYKESFPTERLTSKKRFRKLAEQWGRGLATEHARADKITDYSLATEVARRVGNRDRPFRDMVREVAFGYADQVDQDWRTFLELLAPETQAG